MSLLVYVEFHCSLKYRCMQWYDLPAFGGAAPRHLLDIYFTTGNPPLNFLAIATPCIDFTY